MTKREIPPEVYETVKQGLNEGQSIKVRHEYDEDGVPCSKHKSRALVITKKDGGYVWLCHRCGSRGAIKETPMTTDQIKIYMQNRTSKKEIDGICLPSDMIRITQADMSSTTRRAPWDAITWLLKYGMGGFLERYYFGWSPSLQRVIMPIMSSVFTTQKGNYIGPELIGWVARDPRELSKEDRKKEGTPKYLIKKGGPDRPIFTAKAPKADIQKPFVITEDVFSAIKVADAVGCYAFAMLNTDVPRSLLDAAPRNAMFILWLDNDMTIKMLQLASKLRPLGYNVKYVSTQKDPKCYNEVGIRQVINYIANWEGVGTQL